MSPAIRIDGVSKLYRVGARQQGYRTLRESIADACWSPVQRLTSWSRSRESGVGTTSANPKSQTQYPESPLPLTPRLSGDNFWALKDVSCDVQPGEVVGIIGRNGAGKSTLLKILSRITEPTSGSIELRGRVGSLLEVGTGFHPELSGRENIYMNGSILGMSRREIARKFDEIVDFSGVEDFLDTPVKRYSSGMYVRLAFAVAAHLEPEILIVDEVLAVGDAEFQRKCLGRMKTVARSGRTVLFVSHNMAAIESLCDSAVHLNAGRILDQGPTSRVVDAYRRRSFSDMAHAEHDTFRDTQYFQDASLLDTDGNHISFIPLGGTFTLRLIVRASTPLRHATIGIGIDAVTGERMLTVHSPQTRLCLNGCGETLPVICTISNFPLAPGTYTIKLALTELQQELEAVHSVAPFIVDNAEAFGEGRGFHRGVCVAASKWQIATPQLHG